MQAEILALKDMLTQSDHVPHKFAESLVVALHDATPEDVTSRLIAWAGKCWDEYQGKIEARAGYRAAINDLEHELESMVNSEMTPEM